MIQADIQGFCGGLETFDIEGPDRVQTESGFQADEVTIGVSADLVTWWVG